jgi:hypothetical protein
MHSYAYMGDIKAHRLYDDLSLILLLLNQENGLKILNLYGI